VSQGCCTAAIENLGTGASRGGPSLSKPTFLIFYLPGWPRPEHISVPLLRTSCLGTSSSGGPYAYQRSQNNQVFGYTKLVIHFACFYSWFCTQAAVLGCDSVLKTEIRHAHVYRPGVGGGGHSKGTRCKKIGRERAGHETCPSGN
jgi:hypothetical protein